MTWSIPTLALFSYVQNTASAGHKPQSYSLQVSGRKWDIVINLFEYLIATEVVRDHRLGSWELQQMASSNPASNGAGKTKPGTKNLTIVTSLIIE